MYSIGGDGSKLKICFIVDKSNFWILIYLMIFEIEFVKCGFYEINFEV